MTTLISTLHRGRSQHRYLKSNRPKRLPPSYGKYQRYLAGEGEGQCHYLFQMKRGTVFPLDALVWTCSGVEQPRGNKQVKSDLADSEGNFEVLMAPQIAALQV